MGGRKTYHRVNLIEIEVKRASTHSTHLGEISMIVHIMPIFTSILTLSFLMFLRVEKWKKDSEIERKRGKWVNGTDKVSYICSNAETTEDPSGRLE